MSRRVLVTGASRGIGRAIAVAFAQNGDRVVVHYSSRRDSAQDTLRELPGRGHVLAQADLSSPEQSAGLVSLTGEELGGLDILVNNAAVNLAHPPARTSYPEWLAAWRQIVNVNLLGAANLSYCAAQLMIQHKIAGRIINVGSRGAFRGEPDHPAYGATKAALHSLGQSLAVSLAPYGIAVASVAPGFIATERVAERITEQVIAQSPFRRVGTPQEVASAVLYLASADAIWASGAVLDLNGASYLR